MQSWLEGVLYQSILNAKLTGRSAVSKHIKCKVDWKECCIKAYYMQSWLEGVLYQSILNAKLTELKLESMHQESPHSDIFRKRATSHFWNRNVIRSILPGLQRKTTGLLLSGPKSSFQMKVNLAFNLEIKVWKGTESMFLEVQCEVSTVRDDLDCHVICWCWSTVIYQVQSQCSRLQGDFRALSI